MKIATLLKQGISPMFAPIELAAPLCGLDVRKFQELVDEGMLPSPCKMKGTQVYDMEDVRNTMRGAKPDSEQEFEL
jgi:hypothetical protein